ncbi:Glycosyltransferase involved in cell wall bisynthesis [Jannaschia faecimaris]|uniref:Glycosyltransferase involved in cell wall bisynthesis n=1 Tax=Jannaschia faecimaris TaxID=1244108 RepID=A0A1H3JB17_9RHOB|nr:glycosyltransferase [Jannaschia faecimaris]SDY37131.1 Glycosyltransferase involved in cell wall bisynthesis [Jannaschia faecimaris]
MTAPSISVIINNYNYAPYLSRAIESALDQADVAAQVVVVDDGSTDASRDLIESFGDRIKPVFQRNAGQAAAINAGVKASTGELLCFLDADDWFAPGKLSAVGAAFAANPAAGLVYHRLQPTLSDGSAAFRPIPRSLCDGDLAPMMARTGGVWPFPMTSAVSVRRSLWQRAGDIPPVLRISADAWLVGVYPFLAEVVALPEILGCYRIHDNTWYRAQDDAAMLRKRMSHWRLTIELTNDFLCRDGLPWRLDLADHHAHRVAQAKHDGASRGDRLRLLGAGLRDRAEPNFARRARDAFRAFGQTAVRPQ